MSKDEVIEELKLELASANETIKELEEEIERLTDQCDAYVDELNYRVARGRRK